MSCCEPPSLPYIKMLTLNQVSLLVSKTSPHQDDDNNNVNLGFGALALKMMSSRLGQARPVARAPLAGTKRCLFGAPSPAETQRLIREDQDAAKSRMLRRWGWDLGQERPAPASTNWQWVAVKTRSHPYGKRPEAARLPSPMTVPPLLSPLPATPTAVLNTSATSSSSGTSTLPASPSSPESCASPGLRPSPPAPPCAALPSWDVDSEDSCCGSSDSDSDSSTTCGTSPRPTPVQTRLTDFWRTRRCSTSENIVKANPVVPSTRTPVRTCSV